MNQKIIRGALLVAGTTVGAGMLGIPLITAQAGFWPAVCVTLLAWAIMYSTGLLYLEATLWMPVGSNLLSMSRRFLGKKGRLFSGTMFLFLYYCLLVAYFAAGSPMLSYGIGKLFGTRFSSGQGNLIFGLIFAFIVGLGAHWIDRVNIVLTTGLVLSYCMLLGIGAPEVRIEQLSGSNWGFSLFAMPVLFSAFGYHNILPSLVTYFGKDVRSLKQSILVGTLMALVIYLLWQWIVMGIIPKKEIFAALEAGRPVTAALKGLTGKMWIFWIGQMFAFFALITSLLGVAFSMVDFLADGMKVQRTGIRRMGLSALTFAPPLVLATVYPSIFDKALGVAGGFGEGILNGAIPILLVWVGRYRKSLTPSVTDGSSKKGYLLFLMAMIVLVMLLEGVVLFRK
jgi:tyrosine-specific transport protein